MRTAINNGTIIDPANGIESPGTLVIEDGRIADILSIEQTTGADEVIDATGLLVCPGFVDLHVSLREPGFEEDETIASGTAAALAGGFTSIAALPDTNPVVDSRGSAEFVKRQGLLIQNCLFIVFGLLEDEKFPF